MKKDEEKNYFSILSCTSECFAHWLYFRYTFSQNLFPFPVLRPPIPDINVLDASWLSSFFYVVMCSFVLVSLWISFDLICVPKWIVNFHLAFGYFCLAENPRRTENFSHPLRTWIYDLTQIQTQTHLYTKTISKRERWIIYHLDAMEWLVFFRILCCLHLDYLALVVLSSKYVRFYIFCFLFFFMFGK